MEVNVPIQEAVLNTMVTLDKIEEDEFEIPAVVRRKLKDVDEIQQEQEIKQQVNDLSKKEELLDEYLGIVMKNYDADLDVLRKASDLNEFSLPILATLLREGGNIFDVEALRGIVRSEG